MLLKIPQEKKIVWTSHSKMKMRQYQLSEKRVLSILRKPERKEEGIAPKTIAAMQVSGTKKHQTEVWMMYQLKGEKIDRQIRIISAWRYPGRTPIGQKPTIPDDILEELERDQTF
ncbi:MAG: hypothetical protein Q7S82_01705 [bacterium]|nr:hypothetical protein [bacterium]